MTDEEILKLRKDFPMYRNDNKYKGLPLIYLDNSATTFKPYQVIKALEGYYCDYTSNVHRGDYLLATDADKAYEDARKRVADFINADSDEVSFTSGDTFGLNQVAYGMKNWIDEGDEIVLSLAEHASNVLPWFKVAKERKAVIKYAPLDERGCITPENLKSVMSKKTKVVSLASTSNVLGFENDVKSLVRVAHQYNAYFVVDAAQSIGHTKTDVKDMDCDFLVFSGHKMLGPTGIGAMYGKRELLLKLEPLFYGGEMNARFYKDGEVTLDDLPSRFEAGTQNIAGAIGLAEACNYLDSLGFENIQKHEVELRDLLISELDKNPKIKIYNKEANSGIVTFNVKDIFAQDVATYLGSKGIFVRSGQHCAKLLPEILKTHGTLRASIYIYNTREDVIALARQLEHAEDFLDVFFN